MSIETSVLKLTELAFFNIFVFIHFLPVLTLRRQKLTFDHFTPAIFYLEQFSFLIDKSVGGLSARFSFCVDAHLHLISHLGRLCRFFCGRKVEVWQIFCIHSQQVKNTRNRIYFILLHLPSHRVIRFVLRISFTFLSASEKLKVFCIRARNARKSEREKRKKMLKYISHLT